ncbi:MULTISPECIES: cytochrome c maturation protein CcmE [unclassified Oleiphilus]|jgi:cytochrome c-type biogenesis protein CcmE|uniref:cytochrome c maturation protein CcmE n=1 Tax=unclassified Oleiphilus TaxID=2631174 RepID=UPI0007C3F6F2|nr:MULTISPECIES: cytochrome c maturation protein CcmE [unclassified Oleiphilus]KZY40357.1 cytochrome c biogenesis protein CcmE [Oleiphilus sp. HI0050]KZY77988.1 cytochrome c biogenesis protein CcmE [Oleiphilus sp. HI0069]KZY83898.1 cytochrome c biogenesis protein CcmE [Oleiphilus sp. HI0068]KZY86746.1 cytochrome c biogenesis protein CcmE [Oleiphilus sp. HI0072]KZZ12739.1 cytochrome c biogenesis protein CcmE [Oleiphilus sp. HI0078]KZZ21240.1 cytochrome c biogenesis protein CcmE [Oleiphilus sp.
MHPKRKQRLTLIIFLLVGFGTVIGLAMYALTENINLFYNPTQIAQGEAPKGARIRAGGMVVEGSVKRSENSLATTFALTDYKENVEVSYTGILPDLFREGQGIVALGRLDENNVLIADEVLAKHDENYMPPEVADALEKSGGTAPKGIHTKPVEEGQP